MTDIKILEAFKKFLLENVASKIKLEKPPVDGNIKGKYELVHPAVYIGWVPPKNYLDEFGYDVPCLLVMEDGGQDEHDEANLDIRIGFATYDPGLTYPEQFPDEKTRPNVNGYKDLLNLIIRTRLELSKVAIIENITSIQKPIKWGLYDEQKWPYWHAWLTFKASILPINHQDHGINKFL